MKIRAFITHKKAECHSDCQDRFGVNQDTKSIAVSDGMSQSWQQKLWAEILVNTFVSQLDWNPSLESIKPLCEKWMISVKESIQHLKDTNAPQNIIFRNERSLAEKRSAGATLVGIRFSGNEWNGIVLGDSCLIEWDGSKAKFHTSQDVDAFDNHPDYFDSDINKNGKGTPKNISGTLSNGNTLLMVSDPFSDFLLEHNKAGDISIFIKQILDISTHGEFETLVDQWRNFGMHNDDSTLVIVEYDNECTFDLNHIDIIEELIAKETNQGIAQNTEVKISALNDDKQKEPEETTPKGDSKQIDIILSEIMNYLREVFQLKNHHCIRNHRGSYNNRSGSLEFKIKDKIRSILKKHINTKK